jgi:hypothetical protein
MGLQWAQVREVGWIEVGFVGDFREQIKEAIDRCEKRRVIAQLAAQLVAHATAQVDVGNRYNINSGNDEFHGNRHTSEVNKLRPLPAQRLKGLVQRLNTKQRP